MVRYCSNSEDALTGSAERIKPSSVSSFTEKKNEPLTQPGYYFDCAVADGGGRWGEQAGGRRGRKQEARMNRNLG